jgi:hypothetical protein
MRVYKFLCAKFGLKSLEERRLKISTLSDLNDPFELLPYEMSDRRIRTALLRARDRIAQNRGLLCFSASWSDPVIWAHYSDKHKGLCLGFDIPDDKCQRVTYVGERLPLPIPPTLTDANRWLFTKFENWKYEREVRVWSDLTQKNNDLCFRDFGQDLKLTEVMVGANCPAGKREILQALGGTSELPELIKARAAFRKFEIVRDRRGLR